MPGGGGVIASNYLYNVAPQDGTTLAIITSSFVNEQIFDNPQIRYDARKFLAIGRLLDTTSVLFFWHASPIKTLDDMLHKPSTIAISSVNEVAGLSAARDDQAPRRAVQDDSRLSVGARLCARGRARRDRRRLERPSSGCRSSTRTISRRRSSTSWCSSRSSATANMPDIPTVLELTKRSGGQQDFPPARQQRRDRPLAVHHAQRAAGAACALARRVPEDDCRSGVSRGGAAAEAAARHQDRRRDAEDRRRQLRHFAARRWPRSGS